MERLRKREELRPLHCFAASAILGLPTAVLRLHELLLPVRAARPCVSRALGNQSNPAHCRSWACSSRRQACRCTHAACILPFPSALLARRCNAIVLSRGFVAPVWNSVMHTWLPPDQASRPAKHWSNLPATWKHIPARRRQLSLHLYWINMDFYDYYELLDLHKIRRCKSFSF